MGRCDYDDLTKFPDRENLFVYAMASSRPTGLRYCSKGLFLGLTQESLIYMVTERDSSTHAKKSFTVVYSMRSFPYPSPYIFVFATRTPVDLVARGAMWNDVHPTGGWGGVPHTILCPATPQRRDETDRVILSMTAYAIRMFCSGLKVGRQLARDDWSPSMRF